MNMTPFIRRMFINKFISQKEKEKEYLEKNK